MPGSYETACANKARHLTRQDAINQARKRSTHPSLASNKKLNAYRCDYCNGWHVGNSKTLQRRPFKRVKFRYR